MGNLLTDKYAEGYAGHRFYAGCDNVDAIESHGRASWRKALFGAEHAYLQPHSGADANLVAFSRSSHARSRRRCSSELGAKDVRSCRDEQWDKRARRAARPAPAGTGLLLRRPPDARLPAQHLRRSCSTLAPTAWTARRACSTSTAARAAARGAPLILLAGYSAYPRKINFAKMREIADEVGAVFMVDMAHFAGLVAGKVFTGDFDPVPHAHVVTTTTHKTLRGPRGGIVLCEPEYAEGWTRAARWCSAARCRTSWRRRRSRCSEASQPEFQRLRARGSSTTRGRWPTGCMAAGCRVLDRRHGQPPAAGGRRGDVRPHRPAGRVGAARSAASR